MVINHISVLLSGCGVGFGLIHTTLVVVSGCFGAFRGRRLTCMIQATSMNCDLAAVDGERVAQLERQLAARRDLDEGRAVREQSTDLVLRGLIIAVWPYRESNLSVNFHSTVLAKRTQQRFTNKHVSTAR